MNLEQLLAAMDALAASAEKPRAVTIKGLGEVYIREITIGEIDVQLEETERLKQAAIAGDDKAMRQSLARSACRLLCDETGKRLLDPDNKEHVLKVAKLPLRVLTAINNAQEETETGN